MKEGKKDFLWCSPHPNHYHQYLVDMLRQSGITIDVVYFQKQISKYPWQTDFSDDTAYCLEKTPLEIDWGFLQRGEWKHYNNIVVAGWNEPTMMVMLTLLALKGYPYMLYSDTPAIRKRTGLKQTLRKLWLDYVIRKSRYVLATGKPGVEAFYQSGVEKSKLVNYPFLTNLEYFHPEPKGDNHQAPLIFASGRLDNAHKGYDIALEALAKVKAMGYSFMMDIAGEGPDRNVVEEQIKKLGLEENVVLSGWIEPPVLLKKYQLADIFLHPSRFDPFPNAVLEAMACGLPVICSNEAGSGVDRIIDGYNGWLFESGNVDDLCNKLKTMLDLSVEQRAMLGLNARKTAEKWGPSYHSTVLRKIANNTPVIEMLPVDVD